MTRGGRDGAAAAALALGAVSAALLAVRLHAAGAIGFADSEALYACYALHPQPAYLDHPGLVSLLARLIAQESLLTPLAAHRVTAVLATLVPWTMVLAARLAGAGWTASCVAGLALVAAPEISFGLFALTPDLPLAFAWIGALGLAAAGLRARPSSVRAAASLLFAGTLAGVACAAKVSGILLFVALAVTYASRPAREHARSVWPWAGLLAGALVVAPIALYEAAQGFPLLRHRLVDTQADAGPSLRNLGALAGGQLVYVSPLLLAAAALVALDLVRARRSGDPVTRLLLVAWAVPGAALVLLCLWSRVAEPHWLAPALLALPMHAALRQDAPPVSRRLTWLAVASGLALSGVAHAWVLVPAAARLRPESADAALDIANELVGWPEAALAVREVVDEARSDDPHADGTSAAEPRRGQPLDVAVVGPFYTVCAQLEARLAREVAVGCDDPIRDDFDGWLPRATWRSAKSVIFVTDNRFNVDVEARFPRRYVVHSWTVPVARADRVVRTFRISLLVPRAVTLGRPPTRAPSRAAPRRESRRDPPLPPGWASSGASLRRRSSSRRRTDTSSAPRATGSCGPR